MRCNDLVWLVAFPRFGEQKLVSTVLANPTRGPTNQSHFYFIEPQGCIQDRCISMWTIILIAEDDKALETAVDRS